MCGDIACLLCGVEELLSLRTGIEHNLCWVTNRDTPVQLAEFVCCQRVIPLGFDMEAASGDLDEVLEEDGTVYGEDGTARLTAIAKKYESYTTEALDDLRDELPSKSYQTDLVAALNSRWIEWWDDVVAVHRDRWIAADNGDTVSLTRINERVSALWDEWTEMFDRVAELQEISASDL